MTPIYHKTRHLIASALALGLASPLSSRGQDTKPAEPQIQAPKPIAAVPGQDDTAETALRACMIAMIFQDEPKLRAVILPADDVELLRRGRKPTGMEAISTRMALTTMKIEHLKPGDEIPGLETPRIVVRPDEVSETRAVLSPGIGPHTYRVEKVGEAWRVDVRPLIARFKAADAARAAAKAATQPGGTSTKPTPKP